MNRYFLRKGFFSLNTPNSLLCTAASKIFLDTGFLAWKIVACKFHVSHPKYKLTLEEYNKRGPCSNQVSKMVA
eukprot:snap_masked-scaffold_54-processed-gene-1.88-mRNA-1 protein AED:1.00 eAED:1.00 QI:0/0/0/0/1/1/2/0/72